MKNLKISALLVLTAATLGTALFVHAADKPEAKVTPYTLSTCLVSDEKLGGDMGAPYVFTNGTHEIKFCCKSCLKDFDKEPAKYIKKLEAAEKKEAGKAK